MKTIIVGNGFIAGHLNYPIINERLLANQTYIDSFLDTHKPDVIINCVGFCGKKNIDDCEENKQKTFEANTVIPIMLASACEKKGIRLIQISSGCVFYGRSPQIICVGKFHLDCGWKEENVATPLSTYSKSKYACDLILGTMKNVASLRIRMPISWKNEPRNLLSKLINYKQVVETPNSITLLKDLSRAVEWVVSREASGTYHITSPKPITHSQILNEYKKYVPDHNFTSITPDELDGLVSAPRSNCILDSSKIIKEGFEFLDQDEELNRCVKEFASNRGK